MTGDPIALLFGLKVHKKRLHAVTVKSMKTLSRITYDKSCSSNFVKLGSFTKKLFNFYSTFFCKLSHKTSSKLLFYLINNIFKIQKSKMFRFTLSMYYYGHLLHETPGCFFFFFFI